MHEHDTSSDGGQPPSDLRRSSTSREPACDLIRRRRFLKLVGRAGVMGIGAGGLASALFGMHDEGPGEEPTCTTTTSWTTSSSGSKSFPSQGSGTWSGTESWAASCDYSLTWADAYSRNSGGSGGGPTSNYTVANTRVNANPGSNTYSESCGGGTRSFTYTNGSNASYTSSFSQDKSVTATIPCLEEQDLLVVPPEHRSAAEILPATLDDERAVVQFPGRVKQMRERHLRLFGHYPN